MHTCLISSFVSALQRKNAPARALHEGALVWVWAVLLLLTGCVEKTTFDRVQVVADWENVEPFARMEIRFDEAIAAPGQVGVLGATSPVVISPPVRGEFKWENQRSGVFTCTEPLAMNARYVLSLSSGLRNAEGRPATARLRKAFRTPPFSLTAVLPEAADIEARSEPEVRLFFNEAVDASAARRFLVFRDDQGRRIEAEARQGTIGERPGPYEVPPNRMQTWEERSLPVLDGGFPGEVLPGKAGTNEVSNFVIVCPAKPLPAGNGWRLMIGGGLPSARKGYRLGRASEVAIGNVTPFLLVESSVSHVIHKDPAITLTFSKRLPDSMTNDWPGFIAINPAPARAGAEASGRTLRIAGEFESGGSYNLVIRSNLPAAEPFVLGTNIALQLIVPPVAPRLYFPEFSCEQLAFGNRFLRLLAVNVPMIRVKAKLMTPEDAIHALSGFSHYYRDFSDRSSWEEPYRRLHYPLIPGRTIYDGEQPGAAAQDQPADIDLSWDKLLGGRKTGVVFVEVERARQGDGYSDLPRLGTQTLVQLTDLGIIWRGAMAEGGGLPAGAGRDGRTMPSRAMQAFVFSYSTGKPAKGATVKVVNDEGKVISQAVASAEGIATVRTAGPEGGGRWLCAELEGDFHAVEFDDFNVPIRGFNMEHVGGWWNEEKSESRRVLLFSDREVYRPGETMQLKAIVRDWQGERMVAPGGISGIVSLDDMGQTRIWETNAQFAAMGSWAGAIPLALETRGQYRVELKMDGKTYGHAFFVKDYEPAAFEIEVSSRAAYGPDEKIELPVKAKYYFGQPLSRPGVKWSLRAEGMEFAPEVFKGFDFGRCDLEGRFGRGKPALTLAGELRPAQATNLVIAPEMKLGPEAVEPRAASVLVEITDINNQTLSHQAGFVQHSSEFYLGIQAPELVQEAGEPVPVRVAAASRNGSPWDKPVGATMVLKRVEWRPVRIQGAGRSVRFRTEAVLTNVIEKAVEIAPCRMPEREGDAIAGTVVEGLAPLMAGQYVLEASATDPAGRPVVSSVEFTVSARDRLGWDYKDEAQLVLRPEHAVYAPGETAQILVEAPFSGMACVTVEREEVRRTFTMRLEGNAPVIPVRIEKGDAPNVFISVALVRGMADCPRDIKEPECRVGYAELSVKDPERVLEVAVKTDQPSYLPGRPVNVDVLVKNGAGAPVKDAEVTLYAVDEGVIRLTAAPIPDPFSFFNQPRYLRVRAGTSLPLLMPEDPANLAFGNKGYLGGGGGEEMNVRKNLMACAFWYASLVTDANGQVGITSLAPDSLTRYRIVAVAHTRSGQFGSGKGAFEVSKPLIVEPALPRFANVTDKVLARAVVHNLTKKPGRVIVSLQLDRHVRVLTSSNAPGRIVDVPAGGSAAIEYPVEFIEQGEAALTWGARFADGGSGEFEDAVRSSLTVNYPAPMLRQVVHRTVTESKADLLESVRPELAGGAGTLRVQIGNTRLAGVEETVARLLEYPYGCAEQTCSSLMPWVVLYRSPWESMVLEKEKDPSGTIRSGIARLLAMQRPSGGLAYWPGIEEPMPWVSAYGGVVLALARRSGMAAPDREFNHLLSCLSETLRSTNALDSGVATLSAYALALGGRAEPAYHEKLFASRAKLDAESRRLLALAIVESAGPREMALALLESTPVKSAESAEWFGSDSRAAAIELLAWVCVKPEDPRVANLVAALMAEQKAGDWSTTQGNAWALFALTEYARRVEKEAIRACEGEIVFGDKRFPFRFGTGPGAARHTFEVNASDGPPQLRLENGRGTVFTSVTIAMRPKALIRAKEEHGFRIERFYQRLNDRNELEDAKSLRVGDRVLISLRIEAPDGGRFVAIDDPLPSNIEALDPVFKTQQTRGESTVDDRHLSRGWTLGADFQEIRADRVLYFANHVRPGVWWVRYLGRVRAAADAVAPPAKIEEMYQPDRYALSDSRVISSAGME